MKQLLHAADSENLEIAVGQFYSFWGAEDDCQRQDVDLPTGVLSAPAGGGLRFLEGCFQHGYRRVNVWNKIDKLSFLRSNNIWFKDGLLYEDVPFTFMAMFRAARVQAFPCRVYGYRQRPGSIMSSAPKNAHLSRIWIVDYLLQLFQEEGYSGRAFDDYLAYQLWECLLTFAFRPYALGLRVLVRGRISYRGLARLSAVFFLPVFVLRWLI